VADRGWKGGLTKPCARYHPGWRGAVRLAEQPRETGWQSQRLIRPSGSDSVGPQLARPTAARLAKRYRPIVAPSLLDQGSCWRAFVDAGERPGTNLVREPLSKPIREAAPVLGRSDLASAFLPWT